jgi:hypothetical protein
MRASRSLIGALVACLFACLLPDNEIANFRLTVHSLSSITILGKTNVNKYECAIAHYNGRDTLLLQAERGKGAQFTKGRVTLEASGFDCGMRAMTKDFIKTLKADQYPDIVIEFISFERAIHFDKESEKFKGKINISLANTVVSSDVQCGIERDNNGFFHLAGSRNFKFSDFKLEPPSHMLGMVKVNENLTVNFHMVLVKQ